MAWTNPSVAEFKTRLNRDFPYNSNIDLGVTDTDIAVAFQDTNADINTAMWANQQTYTIAYLLLAAHFLCINIRNASQGVMGQGTWIQNAHGVGSVSQSMTIPQKIQDNPAWAAYCSTSYGLKYVVMAVQQSVGVTFHIVGETQP